MTIAIVGASRDREKFGNKAVRAYVAHGDTVYPINPARGEIEGLRAYGSVLEVPGPIEVASFYVPPAVGLQIIEECARKAIGTVLLNYGSESEALLQRAAQLGIVASVTCSITGIGRSPEEL